MIKSKSFFVLFILLLSACASVQPTAAAPTATKQQTLTASPTALPTQRPTRTLIPTRTATPFLTPTIAPTLDLPLLQATPNISPLALSPYNAGGQMKLLDKFGTGQAFSVQYSHDGEHLLIGSSTGIYVNDATTYTQNSFLDTGYPVDEFYLSQDDALAAIPNYEKGIDIWSLVSGQMIHTLNYPGGFHLYHMAFSSQGYIVAAGVRNDPNRCPFEYYCVPMLIAWTVSNSTYIQSIEGEIDSRNFPWNEPMEFSQDGNTLAIGLRLYDPRTLEFKKMLEIPGLTEEDYLLRTEVFNENDAKLIVSLYDHQVRKDFLYLFNIQDGSSTSIPTLSSAYSIYQVGTKALLLCEGDNYKREIRWVDFTTGIVGEPLEVTKDIHYLGTALNKDGTHLAVMMESDDPNFADTVAVQILDLITNQMIQSIEFDNVTAMAAGLLNVSGGTPTYVIISGDSTGEIRFYDAITHQIIKTLPSKGRGITNLLLSADQNILAALDSGDRVYLWNLEKDTVVLSIPTIRALFFDMKGRTLISFFSCKVQWLSISDQQVEKTYDLKCPEHGFNADEPFSLSPENQVIAFLPNLDGKLRFQNLNTDATVLDVDAKGEFEHFSFNALAVSPDGKYLAMSGYQPVIYVFDLRTGKLVNKLAGHEYISGDGIWTNILKLQFSPANHLLLSVGMDGTTRLWNVETGSMLRVLNLGGVPAYSRTQFSPDGRFLVTSDFGVIRIWGLPPWP